VKLIYNQAEWNSHWFSHIQKNQKIGFVPTMGALHQGHLDLVENSISSQDVSIISIFVNPTQFNNREDFEKYPNTLQSDLDKLEKSGVDYVFLPNLETIYPNPVSLKMDFDSLEKILEGRFRPGHFNGVGIVVSKLFHIIKPHTAFFGQKDLQQVAVIKRLVQDLSFDLKLEVVPTRRETDGLAMSSRNLRLSPEERKSALVLFQCLNFAKQQLLSGQSWIEIKRKIEVTFDQVNDAKLEYVELVNADTFEVFTELNPTVPNSVCIAGFIGEIRLIDNMTIIP
jgi:pantoate--beta-alanine ligase